MAVRRIAHISDPHILAARATDDSSVRTRIVSALRPLDAEERRHKFLRALRAARASGADHLVVSGDLTEMGTRREFEQVSELLHASRFDPTRVTLVPGNHDAYSNPGAWRTAIEGPLREFRHASAAEPGKVIDCGPVALMPLDVTCYQSIARSAGEFTEEAATALERRVSDPALRSKAVVVVQHHPPFGLNPIMHWFDGLRGHARLTDLLKRFAHVQVLHGHLHRVIDRIIGFGRSRIFGAPAIVEDQANARVRLYDVREGAIEAAGLIAG
jgi:3',5'-cyclic AMP phosphodiesterase CpdA